MSQKRPTIAIDAMGGDLGPGACVEGACKAVTALGDSARIMLVGDENILRGELTSLTEVQDKLPDIEIVHAPRVIGMDAAFSDAIRQKDSSIAIAMKLLKERTVDALVSTGNTGAVMASGAVTLGTLEGVNRPAIACFFPSDEGQVLVLDVGANPVCKVRNLYEFAVMGSALTRNLMGISRPKIGLLSNGEESSKGTELTTQAHRALKESKLNFIGNVEGRDILLGRADVVLCDGFTGNILLKFAESIAGFLKNALRRQLARNYFSRAGAVLMGPFLRRMGGTFDYQKYGGAPLLGLDGVCIVCHGRSTGLAVSNAAQVAGRMVNTGVNSLIVEMLSENGQPSVNGA